MPNAQDVDAYIQNADEEARSILQELRALIKKTIPEAVEGVSYNVPFYHHHGEFVGFAAYKKHVSFGFGADVLEEEDAALLAEKGYKLGKGTLQIKLGQKVPVAEIEQLLLAKAKMNEAQSAAK